MISPSEAQPRNLFEMGQWRVEDIGKEGQDSERHAQDRVLSEADGGGFDLTEDSRL